MRFMVIVKATRESEDGIMPSTELLTAMGQYNEELARAGILLAGEGLHPSSKGARVVFKGKERTDVEEYSISEGWIRVAAGKSKDRFGQPMTIKLSGEVEAWFEDVAGEGGKDDQGEASEG